MPISSPQEPDSIHWIYLYLLRRMKQVLEERDRVDVPFLDSWVKHRHVTFLVADELRRAYGLNFGLQTTLHILDIDQIAQGPTIVNIAEQCRLNGWIIIPQNGFKLHDLTRAGLLAVDRALRENRSITGINCPHAIPVNSVLPLINRLVDVWSLANMAQLTDFYRDVIVRNTARSPNPVAHYEIHRDPQSEAYFKAARL